MTDAYQQARARDRYQRELNKAQIQDLLSRISGTSDDLFKFDEVASLLHARQRVDKGTQQVPLDKIVGSVGRYKDFTRSYLPRPSISPQRWADIDTALNSPQGLPPVELYKLGDVYFVRDGNHRVSVARANGLTQIEAYVTEYETDVALTVDDFERDQWMIKAEHDDFMQKTQLDRLIPDNDLRLTEPGRYEIMLRHIEVHRYLRNENLEREGSAERLSWLDAVESWYNNIYMTIAEAIRSYDVLSHFPQRTEADLYLWIAHHRERLAIRYELAPLTAEEAVSTFVETHSDLPIERALQMFRLRLRRALQYDEVPLGMSDESYEAARARHDAGEITLAEAEDQRAQADGPEPVSE